MATFTTYNIGLYQSRAYRLLAGLAKKYLKKHGLGKLEWLTLGLLTEHPKGLRSVVIAEALNVKNSFVTRLVDRLENKKFVKRLADPVDRRARYVRITKKGIVFLQKVEKEMQKDIAPVIKDISRSDLQVYLSVLERIIANSTT